MKKLILIVTVVIFFYTTHAQSVAINNDGSTANASSILDVKSNTKGILIPRMSKTEKNAIASPTSGLLIYQTSPDSIGFYYYNGSTWLWLQNANNNWSTSGNTSTDTSTNFLGTINNMPLRFKLNNNWAGQWDIEGANFSIGLNANKNLQSPTASQSTRNIAMGNLALFENSMGADNVAIGQCAMQKNASSYNVAIGSYALRKNTNGFANVAIGYSALDSTINGIDNTALGDHAMTQNISGSQNTAIGANALYSNNGSSNIAIGVQAGQSGKTMTENIIIGNGASLLSKSSSLNTIIGNNAFLSDTSGSSNVVLGHSAMLLNKNGNNNVALGFSAGRFSNIYSNNIFLGYQAGYNSKSHNKLYIENSNADSTNALIYGDFAADSLNLNAKVNIRDYTRLGAPTTGAPAIKMKKLTFTNGGAGAFTSVAHGLTQSKILSVSVLIFANSFNDIAPRSTFAGYEYDMFFGSTDITIVNIAGNDLGLQARPGRILITYEE